MGRRGEGAGDNKGDDDGVNEVVVEGSGDTMPWVPCPGWSFLIEINGCAAAVPGPAVVMLSMVVVVICYRRRPAAIA